MAITQAAGVGDLLAIVRCPKCHARLAADFSCPSCGPYPIVAGQPALIDFDDSILDRGRFERTEGRSPVGRGRSLIRRLSDAGVSSPNRTAMTYARAIVERVRGGRVLVIGGGAMGAGAEPLYTGEVEVVGTDIYPTANTRLVADGHKLPFQDDVFDAVWIQAVLEHVVDPARVAGEIWRVLKPGGVVYADTPFMQQVHEGAYDFTRFTLSGHRWLFRRFVELDSGVVSGAGTMLQWAIRYFGYAVSGSKKLGTALAWPFFWLRYFDGANRAHADAACGVFFYGAKGEATMKPSDLVTYYEEFGRRRSARTKPS